MRLPSCCLQDELAARAQRYGINAVRPPREVTFWQLVAEALQARGACLAASCLARPPRAPGVQYCAAAATAATALLQLLCCCHSSVAPAVPLPPRLPPQMLLPFCCTVLGSHAHMHSILLVEGSAFLASLNRRLPRPSGPLPAGPSSSLGGPHTSPHLYPPHHTTLHISPCCTSRHTHLNTPLH